MYTNAIKRPTIRGPIRDGGRGPKSHSGIPSQFRFLRVFVLVRVGEV